MPNNESKTIIQESQIFGPISSYMWYHSDSEILIEAQENYQKRSFRNRYQILTSNGPLTLSIPLTKGKNQQMSINEVKISYDEDWTRSHIHAIRSSYGKSPYFEFYFHDVASLLMTKYEKLVDLNQAALLIMIKLLKINKKPQKTDTFVKSYETSKYLDIRDQTIESLKFQYYQQVWEHKFGFQKNLSILDLLFCKGPESILVLKETLAANQSQNNKIEFKK